MKIDCTSDLHGHYPQLNGGDLLIVAGDLTARHTVTEWNRFRSWICAQDYREKIVIAGNHDNFYEKLSVPTIIPDFKYLCDSGTEFEGLKIWGSPWSLTFPGINPKCTAFTGTEEELAERYALIPDNIDILITHGPPWGILDKTCKNEHVGSKYLGLKIGLMKIPPKLWIWGHIHEAYGEDKSSRQKTCKMMNVSHVNEHYQPVNKPIRVIL
jgi:Icc-related predicted phosphoesterase